MDSRKCRTLALIAGRSGVALMLWTAVLPAQQPAATVAALVNGQIDGLVATYKTLHAAPELSHQEAKTSAFFAAELRAMGYDVTERVGKYDNPAWTGYGVVAVLQNGAGPVVLIRTELDALPVEERTGLPYASHVTAKSDAGLPVSVGHMCGHDIHIASMLGTAKDLATLKSQWHGTLVIIGQPAEETINGAKAMLADGLYTRFPKPEVALALHDSADLEAGKIGLTSGYMLASATSVDIVMWGISAHGSRPEVSKDPVVAAAELVVALQAIVSRENSPFDPAVVTVGSIQAGTKNNIIPDQAKLQLSIRTYDEGVRQRILASLERMAKGIALTDGLPPDRPPTVTVTEYTTATYNDPALTERLQSVFVQTFGAANVITMPREMASEDFGFFGLDGHQIPIVDFRVGAVDPAKMAESQRTGVPLPSLHSSLFAPLPKPTITGAVTAMTAAVLYLMK
jgi:amidohydrolase